MHSGTVRLGDPIRSAAPFSWTVCAILLCVLLLIPAASANTTMFSDSRICGASNCQALSYYGVLLGGDGLNVDTLTINGGWMFSSGIAVGGSSDLDKTNTNSTNDIVDFSTTVVTHNNCSHGNFCGNGTLSGATPTNANATRVTDALSQYDSILSTLSAATFLTGNGSQTSLPTTGALNIWTDGLGAGSIKIYRNTSSFTQSGVITLGCGGSMCNANDLVVISMGANMTLNRDFNLADGLTADQVIFYIPTSTLTITPVISSNIFINGSFLMGSGAASIGDSGGGTTYQVNMNGRVYSNTSNITFTNKGGAFTDQGLSPVPEPGTWAMLASGFAAIVWGARRKRKNASNGK